METPTVIDERERERVDSSPGFPRRHKILFGIVVTVGILVYASFNLLVYRYAKGGKGTSPDADPRQAVLKGDSLPKQGVTFIGLGSNSGTPPSSAHPGKPAVTPTPTLTPSPTPRPTGPGQYACSQEGVCNVYSDAMRSQYCIKTYADSRCLDQCGKKENQCVK